MLLTYEIFQSGHFAIYKQLCKNCYCEITVCKNYSTTLIIYKCVLIVAHVLWQLDRHLKTELV